MDLMVYSPNNGFFTCTETAAGPINSVVTVIFYPAYAI